MADWDSDNEITNASGVVFISAGSWSYNLVDTVAPPLGVLAPANGGTLDALAQAEVTFSEPVEGMDAADLLVNGVMAATISGTGAGRYVFSFYLTLTFRQSARFTQQCVAANLQ